MPWFQVSGSEIRRRESGEHDQRDHLLHRFELSRGMRTVLHDQKSVARSG